MNSVFYGAIILIFLDIQDSAVFQSESRDAASEATTCTVNPQTDQGPR